MSECCMPTTDEQSEKEKFPIHHAYQPSHKAFEHAGHGRVRHVADDRYFHLVPPVVHVAPPQRRYDRSHDSKSANDCIDIAIKVLSTISTGNLSDARVSAVSMPFSANKSCFEIYGTITQSITTFQNLFMPLIQKFQNSCICFSETRTQFGKFSQVGAEIAEVRSFSSVFSSQFS